MPDSPSNPLRRIHAVLINPHFRHFVNTFSHHLARYQSHTAFLGDECTIRGYDEVNWSPNDAQVTQKMLEYADEIHATAVNLSRWARKLIQACRDGYGNRLKELFVGDTYEDRYKTMQYRGEIWQIIKAFGKQVPQLVDYINNIVWPQFRHTPHDAVLTPIQELLELQAQLSLYLFNFLDVLDDFKPLQHGHSYSELFKSKAMPDYRRVFPSDKFDGICDWLTKAVEAKEFNRLRAAAADRVLEVGDDAWRTDSDSDSDSDE